jgi:hypothetical protein
MVWARHTSVQMPAMIRTCRPVASTAGLMSGHALVETIDGRLVWKHLPDLVEHRIGERPAVRTHRRQHRRDSNGLGRDCEPSHVIDQQAAVYGLDGERHPRLLIDQDQR